MKDIHSHYLKFTGLDLPYRPLWHDAWWHQFLKEFKKEDLTLVIRHIKARYPDHSIAMLRFGYLIVQLDRFAELLAEAKATHKPRKTDRDKVLEMSGRSLATNSQGPKSLDQIMRETKTIESFIRP